MLQRVAARQKATARSKTCLAQSFNQIEFKNSSGVDVPRDEEADQHVGRELHFLLSLPFLASGGGDSIRHGTGRGAVRTPEDLPEPFCNGLVLPLGNHGIRSERA